MDIALIMRALAMLIAGDGDISSRVLMAERLRARAEDIEGKNK